MTKIALITDTHFGVRNNNLGLLNYFKEFYDDIFFPVLKEKGIQTIVHLGDLVDNRKHINYNSAYIMRRCFLEKLDSFKVYIIAGNHDCYHKNTNEVNALRELVLYYPNIKVYDNPVIEYIHDTKVLMLPWINPENEETSTELIKHASINYCFAHLELAGFEMSIGSVANHGMSSSMFTKIDNVYTGHYHHKSSKGNIHYLGAPYEMTWADYDDPRGFHILDLETSDIEFIKNPNRLFHKIIYDENNLVDISLFTKKYVKVFIKNKTNNLLYEKFLDDLEKQLPYDIQVIDTNNFLKETLTIEDIEKAQDALEILGEYINEIPDKINKDKLKNIFKQLYDEANIMRG